MDDECVQCSRPRASSGELDFYLLDDYGSEMVCEPCAQDWMQCDCCTRLHHESAVWMRKSKWNGKEQWLCDECIRECGVRCEVLKGIDDQEYIRKQAEEQVLQDQLQRRAQVSEVRETLRVTLERQANRNRTNV